VQLNGQKVTDFKTPIALAGGEVLKVGRKICKLKIG
jgi:hypothetical protein